MESASIYPILGGALQWGNRTPPSLSPRGTMRERSQLSGLLVVGGHCQSRDQDENQHAIAH